MMAQLRRIAHFLMKHNINPASCIPAFQGTQLWGCVYSMVAPQGVCSLRCTFMRPFLSSIRILIVLPSREVFRIRISYDKSVQPVLLHAVRCSIPFLLALGFVTRARRQKDSKVSPSLIFRGFDSWRRHSNRRAA